MAIRDFSINDIINEQIKNADISVDGYNAADNTANNTADIADTANVADYSTNEIQKAEDNEIQKAENIPVRYEGGETELDRNGQPYKAKVGSVLGKVVSNKESEDIKAKKGEPEDGYEWAQDAAQKIMDTGKTYEEVEKDLANEYKLSQAQIDDDRSQYYGRRELTNDILSERYKLDRLNGGEQFDTIGAVRLLRNNKSNLHQEWLDLHDLKDINSGAEFLRRYTRLKSVLADMDVYKSAKELKKLGFNSLEAYKGATNYLVNSLDTWANDVAGRMLEKDKAKEGVKPLKVKEETAPTEKVAATPTEETTTTTEKTAPTTEKTAPTEDTGYEATLANLTKEQEEKAFKEAEELANREKSREEAEAEEKEIDKAARKAQQNKLDYEEWVKNPTLISGIFGKSGLSTARRVGLGLAALFAIFSDVAASYGKGIRGNTDFKTEAMDALNSTIKTIQDKRAESIGDMAAAPYGVTTENDKKLLKDIEKIKNLPLGRYMADEGALRGFIQEAQITTEPLSEDYYNRFSDALKEGYINSIKNTPSLRDAYLDENGNLNDYGELQFLNKKKNAIENLGNIIEKSDERLSNIDKLLDIDEKNAKVKSTVHDAFFNTNADYINAIRVLQDENRVLEQSKLELTEAKTLDQMLESAGKFKNTVSGLSTSTSNSTESESNTEAEFNRYVESKGREEVNRELEKHGWQAELNGEVGATFPLKVVPISAELKAGGKWTNEQAQEYIDTWKTNKQKEFQDQLTKVKAASSASGTTIDAAAQAVYDFLNTEKAKGAEADFNKARENAIRAIDEKINYNNTAIEKLQEMQNTENKGKYSTSSTDNPYISMYNDVPTKNSEWYKHMLALS